MSKPKTDQPVLGIPDKQALKRLLHDYENDVKTADEIRPFVDRMFENLRRLNLGVK